jgi:hypothetical protein
MTIRQVAFAAAVITAVAISPAASLKDTQQVLTGGGSMPADFTVYTAPGLPMYASNLFNNKGHLAAEVLMPAGTLSQLRVKLVLPKPSSDEFFELIVLKNGASTPLRCFRLLEQSSSCYNNTMVTFGANDRLSISVKNTSNEEENLAFTYSMVFY